MPGLKIRSDEYRIRTVHSLAARDGWRCTLCGIQLKSGKSTPLFKAATIDHIVETCIGGGDEMENLRLACAKCNGSRPAPTRP